MVIVALQHFQAIGVVSHQEIEGQPGLVEFPDLLEQSLPPFGVPALANPERGFAPPFVGKL
jgi:hypothetical protein